MKAVTKPRVVSHQTPEPSQHGASVTTASADSTQQQPLQPAASHPQQPHGDADVSTRVLDRYPDRLFARDMAMIFRLSLKRFYALDREGAFLFAEIRPRIGRKSWSRDRVRQYFAGELRGLSVARKRA